MDQLSSLRQSTGLARCLACGKCTTMCPLAAEGDFSARLIAGQDLQEEIQGRGVGVGRCLTCASCEVRCPEEVHFTEFVRGLRGMIPTEVRRPCPHAGVFQSIARSMAEGVDPVRSDEWLDHDLEVAEEGELALFVGCLPFFDLYFQNDLGIRTLDSARGAIRVLNQLGIEPVLVSQERCCGHDLLWGGDREPFEALAKANAEVFSARGVKHIVTTCAECCRTWRLDYPEVVPDYTPRVEHFAEFLAGRVEADTLQFRSNGEALLTYQDPCRLGRHLGVFDAPRRLLEALPDTELVEMNRTGRDALCCGTSGFIHCDAASRRLQQQRLREATATGAAKLVTTCPKCLIHFSCAQSEDRRREGKEPSIEVEDLTVLAARMLATDGEPQQGVPVLSGRETGEAR
ncbi:MAG: (Fe-S)-binding protein [Candidatus Krumholzibacteriia bacterium]